MWGLIDSDSVRSERGQVWYQTTYNEKKATALLAISVNVVRGIAPQGNSLNIRVLRSLVFPFVPSGWVRGIRYVSTS